MKKKFLGLVVALSLTASLITGCGSDDSAKKNANNAEAAQTEATEAEETTEAAKAEATEAKASDTDTDDGDKVIKVGACVTPHAEILGEIKDDLEAEGWTLEVVEYNDYVLPNTALEDGDLDANYFQHKPYLDDFNKENGTHIVTLAAVHLQTSARDLMEQPSQYQMIQQTKQEHFFFSKHRDSSSLRKVLVFRQQYLISKKMSITSRSRSSRQLRFQSQSRMLTSQ